MAACRLALPPGTGLSDHELAVLEHIVEALKLELAGRLVAVWLFGSRARGPATDPDSDIDLLVPVGLLRPSDPLRAIAAADAAAESLGADPLRCDVRT
ncbi:MAG TPA: nucleotidyltransferase domain-containing protein [Solirubrobacteraceae bacterium]|nr:nucleotidyltransferase domain-containing protein [Solirubrobacteraceae bacterium]